MLFQKEVGTVKSKTCCLTGHREILWYQRRRIYRRTVRAIKEHIRNGYRYFGTGGAIGFDTVAAQAVLKLKKKYPDVRLILVLPCVDQGKYWKAQDVAVYERIKCQADKVVYTSQEYTSGCMLKRNRHLVENSSACICYLKKSDGGTFYTVNLARSLGLSVQNIAG